MTASWSTPRSAPKLCAMAAPKPSSSWTTLISPSSRRAGPFLTHGRSRPPIHAAVNRAAGIPSMTLNSEAFPEFIERQRQRRQSHPRRSRPRRAARILRRPRQLRVTLNVKTKTYSSKNVLAIRPGDDPNSRTSTSSSPRTLMATDTAKQSTATSFTTARSMTPRTSRCSCTWRERRDRRASSPATHDTRIDASAAASSSASSPAKRKACWARAGTRSTSPSPRTRSWPSSTLTSCVRCSR